MDYNKKSFLTTVVEASLLVWILKAALSGLIQAFFFCLAKKRLDGGKKD